MLVNAFWWRVAYKAIYNPNPDANSSNPQYVTIPIVASINFVDGTDQFWERIWNFVNDATNNNRVTHTVTVYNTGGPR